MNTQELIERNIRLTIGDLHVQLLLANIRIEELTTELAARGADKSEPMHRPNGKDKPDAEEKRT